VDPNRRAPMAPSRYAVAAATIASSPMASHQGIVTPAIVTGAEAVPVGRTPIQANPSRASAPASIPNPASATAGRPVSPCAAMTK